MGTSGDTTLTVTTTYGVVRGRRDGFSAAFLGMPFAAEPFEMHRLRPPIPPAPWDGVRDARQYGPTAPKPVVPPSVSALLPNPEIKGRNCLNLNVWTPDIRAEGLPVFVWVHGGSFLRGSGALATYRGTSFARDGVVCVTLNYRLGAEGFAVTGDGLANLGLRDQIAALSWVQDNIAAFGGNPERVTIAGESAGALSVLSLMAAPVARGTFHRAVVQSTPAAAPSRRAALEISSHLAERLGVEASREGLAQVAPDELAEASGAVASQIASNSPRWSVLGLDGILAFGPVVDADILPADPFEAIRTGASGNIPLLIGANAEEGRFFLLPGGMIDADDSDGLAAMLTAASFHRPADEIADTHRGPTWSYRFQHRSTAVGGRLGAAHATELPFVFDTLDSEGAAILGDARPQSLADEMHAAWVAFARDGDPGWDRHQAGAQKHIFG